MGDYPDLHAARMAVTWDMNNPKAVFELPLMHLDVDLLQNAAYRLKVAEVAHTRSLVYIKGEPWIIYYKEETV